MKIVVISSIVFVSSILGVLLAGPNNLLFIPLEIMGILVLVFGFLNLK